MTARRKRARTQHTLLNCDQFAELACGPEDAAIRVPPYYKGFDRDMDAMREVWQKHREMLLRWWVLPCSEGPSALEFVDKIFPWFCVSGYPGTRPWAWWRFDAPDD
ncbi:MAG: hypothetical protein GEU87_13675, partial [Alphaproteobacteria bacterium]|nr:hypothetical protein [Alphaproteobacteria bacterium]